MAWLIDKFDWRTTLVITGIGLWVICLPICLIMRHRPEQYGYLPDGETNTETDETNKVSEFHSPKGIMQGRSIPPVVNFSVKAALRTRTFWLLSFTFFFQHIATSAIMVHIVPYLESVNVPTAIAASAVTGMTLCSLMGRLSFGLLGDFADKRYLIAIAFTLQTIGVFIFSFISSERAWLVIPFLLSYAPGYGGPIPLRPALQADYFGTTNFGTIMGLMTLISMLGGLLSPVFAGWIFDTMGSYSPAWRLLTLTVIPGIPLILLAKQPEIRS
jgi:sugar phosphate permease